MHTFFFKSLSKPVYISIQTNALKCTRLISDAVVMVTLGDIWGKKKAKSLLFS